MRLLLNMNLPRSLGLLLAEAGHISRHAADVGMAQAPDRDILSAARDSGEVVVTHDLDYGELLAFSGDAAPSVVILRLQDLRLGSVTRRLLLVLRENQQAILTGALLVVREDSVRVRPLPIGWQD